MKRLVLLAILSVQSFVLVQGPGICDALTQTEASATYVSSPENLSQAPGHIQFLMHTGNAAQALKAYQEYHEKIGRHDFELIERIGLILLDQGFRTRDPETQVLTLFGAGISLNEKALYILEEGIASGQPQLELIALHFLSKYHNDRADQALHKAMHSNSLLIRLEAVFQLAGKKDPKAVGLIEGLMAKVPEEIWPIFTELFALNGTPEAKKILRKLLTHQDEQIRVASIITIAEAGHDDLLPAIRRLASHQETIQQEACAAALGAMRDETSSSRLMQLARSVNPHVRLAAMKSLYQLGREEIRLAVEKLAKDEDLFAINVLGEMTGSENVLSELLKNNHPQIRLNAAMALLELADPRCLPVLSPILLKDSRDYALLKGTSPGKSLHAWKAVPSARQNFDDDQVSHELSLSLRETALTKAIELPEKDFLTLANAIFDTQQNDLIPVLVELLENHPTPAIIDLLKKYQQKAGAPLVRNYCNLALYRMKQPGPYADNLMEWVTQQRNIDLIRFRPLVPWELREKGTNDFELTPQDTSRILVEAFESFVSTQDDKGIDMLISVLQSGNQKNKYALIGLLMRAIQ